MPLPPHRTARERAAQASAAAAIARAQAHTRPAPPDEDDDETWPPSPAAWRTRCRQIRQDIEENRRHG